jgi:hypothetical protein
LKKLTHRSVANQVLELDHIAAIQQRGVTPGPQRERAVGRWRPSGRTQRIQVRGSRACNSTLKKIFRSGLRATGERSTKK